MKHAQVMIGTVAALLLAVGVATAPAQPQLSGTWVLDRAGTILLRGTGEVTVEPASSHGVHLHISRYGGP